MGLLDMSLLAINNITPFSPSVGTFTLPYVIRDVDEAQKLIHSEDRPGAGREHGP